MITFETNKKRSLAEDDADPIEISAAKRGALQTLVQDYAMPYLGSANSLFSLFSARYDALHTDFLARSHHQRMISLANSRALIESTMSEFAKGGLNYSPKNVTNPQKVSIVGLGPGGLITAIRAFEEGALVTGIEKRPTYTRNNTLRLTAAVFATLKRLFHINALQWHLRALFVDPEHPLRKLFAKGTLNEVSSNQEAFYTIATKDFEALLFSLLSAIEKSYPERVKIHRSYHYVPGSMNQGKKSILINNHISQLEIETDILIGADGVASQVRQDCGIELENMSTTSHSHYAAYTFHPDGSSHYLAYSNPQSHNLFLLNSLISYGWLDTSLPVARFFKTVDQIYLGIEIPNKLKNSFDHYQQQISDAKKEERHDDAYRLEQEINERLTSWGRHNLTRFLSKADINTLVLKSHALFAITLQKAKKAAHVTDCGMKTLLVGEAFQSAHFQTGRGAITAINEGEAAAKAIEKLHLAFSEQRTLDQYERELNAQASSLFDYTFHFPSGENLRVNSTLAFTRLQWGTRLQSVPGVRDSVIEAARYFVSKFR